MANFRILTREPQQSRPCRLHALNICLWQVACVVSKSPLWLESMSRPRSARREIIVNVPIRHNNAESGIPHYMNMQCRRKKQRSSDTIQQIQQRVSVDRLSEKAECAPLQIVVFRMLARFVCDHDDRRGWVRMNRSI